MNRLVVLLTTLCLLAPVARATPTLYLIGDSTVNNSAQGQQGWGKPIEKLFDPAKVRVVNKARGGRSSRTYYAEGLWDEVAAELKPGDFVLMQFGHNDGGSLNDPKGRASIKGNGDETQDVTDAKTGRAETVHSYGWYLRKYCTDAKAKGATPIVCSPIPRNIWKDDHTVARASSDYGKWAAEAAKQAGAPFIDLNAIVAKHYDQFGQEKVKSEFFTPTDHTHTTPAGAAFNAGCVTEGIRSLTDCPLREGLTPGG